ncbi:phage tail spike protein [Bacillus tropicus]|uniref:phage tail spike protein n=1 Tax=Bacillus TaxID=1386 RepID=UPI000937940A|nr:MULTISPECIES: phage tail spike protein [Bacillus]MCU4999544.1 tail fiber domain-containing protein [Bacillus tropicus]UBM49770.1 tail fiber domain-containing protein [Bacillus sp. CRB-7]
MRTPSGELHVVDFKTEQIVASIQPADYWGDKRHWEIKNNIDTLEFIVVDNTRHSSTLMQQNLVLKEVRDGRIVPYVITEIEKNSDDRSVTTYASGEWIQLAKAGIIPPQKLEGKTVIEMVDIALAGTKWQKGNLEYASFRSMTIDEFIDPLSFLKKIASLFELEIQYRAEVVGSQVVGRYVDMIKKRGQETGKEITLGKDLLGIKRIENSQNICTALLGFVKKEGGEFITITEINKGVPYLVDNDAFQRWNEKGQHKFGFYSPETENDDMDAKRLMTLMNTELKKRVNSSVFYEVEAQSIGRVFGLAHELINEGDTTRIKDTGFTPKLYLEARAIAGDESFKNPLQDKYVFGDYHEIVDPNDELRKIYNRILSSLGNKQEMIDQLDKLVKEANETASNAKRESEAAKTLAEKVQENIKNNTVEIIESKNPPTTGLKPYKTLWRDISNGKPGILKIWTGTAWESVVPDVESVKKETLEQVSKDIESTKTELNQKVQSVEGKAQEIAGQIVDVQKQVNNKVDQTWINSQLKDKADKSGVYTKDEIKDGFIGKQVYETDKQGNVQKFQDINTSIGQTNEALTQKAEKSELKKTNEGLSQLEQKTNEIKTTADGTKQTLTELKSKVDSTKVGGENVLLNTMFNDMKNWTAVTGVSVDTNTKYKGYNTLKSDQKGNATVVYRGAEQKNVPFNIGQPYTASFYVMTDDISTFDDLLRIEVICERDDNTRTATFRQDIDIAKLGNNTWGRYMATGVIPEGTTKVRVCCRVWKNGRVWIALPQFEEGNLETNWKPAITEQVTTVEFEKKTVEIETKVDGIKSTVSNVQSEQGKLTERMTKSEQTADGFKTSIESLTKKDTEISNKLNTVESTVEGTKKTLSDVQQTTNDLKKTTTEIEEKAGKITEKLTSLETREVNVRNYVTNSDFSNDKYGWNGITNALTTKIVDVAIPSVPEIKKGLQLTSNGAFVTQILQTEPFINKKGVASCYMDVKTVTSTSEYPRLYMRFTYDQNGKNQNYYFIFSQKEVTNGWTRISVKFDTTKYTGTLKEVRVNLATANTITVDATFTGIMVTFGDLLESWNLAPEDGVTQGNFQSKTTEIEKSVDGVKTTVTNVQNSQAGFEKRMTTVEQTASGLSSTVSNLNNVVSDQGKKLTEANTKLEQQATAIGAKVELKQVEDYVAGFKIPELKQTVNQNKQDLLDELANKLATEQFNQKMTLIDNRFTINEQGLDLAAKKTEVYTKTQADGQFATDSYVRDMESRLQLTEKGVSISVKENDVIAAINMSKENIRLNAARIDLVGKVNAEWIKAGMLSGCQVRTSNTDNYVSLDDQFIRLYEKGVARSFLGHYRRTDGSVQPTFILGTDEKTSAPAGALFMSQAGAGWSGAYASIGISDSIVDGTVQKSVYWELQRNGLSVLNANDYHVFYAGNGSWYFRRGKTGLYQTSLVVEDNSTESDLRLPNVTIRNSRASGYTGVIQLKSSVTQNGWGAVQGNFMTPSLREYKSNIRDISFSALEKVRSLKIRQFNYKNAVNELYRMREEKNPDDPPLTTEDIKTYYGLIVDECDEMFVDESGKGIHLYSYASIGIKGLQEVDATVQEQEIEIAILKSQVASQEDRIARLEELLLQQLIDKKPEQS